MPNFFANLPLLMGQPAGGTGQAGGGSSMITMLATFALIIVIFYFLIIRPQRKKQKDTQSMQAELTVLDRVERRSAEFDESPLPESPVTRPRPRSWFSRTPCTAAMSLSPPRRPQGHAGWRSPKVIP